MKKLIKEMLSKNPERFYVHNLALKEAGFEKDSFYQYIVDVKNKKMLIVPSEEGEGNKVVGRKVKNGYKPVIDIRNKEALSVFEGATHLQIKIFENEIVVEGFVEEKQEENLVSKAKKVVKKATQKALGKSSKVTDISEFMSVKKKETVVFSREDLKQAAGDVQQLSFEDFAWEIAYGGSTSTTSNHIRTALKDIKIPLQIVELFAGAGIMGHGFKKAGFETLFAVDIDEAAAETYRRNHGEGIIQVGDITQMDKSLFPKAPVVIGGVPCTAFTKVNMTKRFLDHPDFFLFKQFIETVKNNENCKVFMIENVEDFITALDGYCVKQIQEELSDFEITYGVLNSAHYGTPMVRKRAIMIGSKIGKIDLPEPIITDKTQFTTVREAFEGLHDGIPNMLDFNKHKKETIERMKHIPQGGNHFDIPEVLRTFKAKFSDYHKRLSWDKPSVSMVHPRKSLITHPEKNRVVSVRECARIFGLPDDYVFHGKPGDTKGKMLDAMQQQIANSVPVQLTQAVAEKIKNAIMQFNIRNRTTKFQTV